MRSINIRAGLALAIVAVLYLLSPEANADTLGVHLGSVHSNKMDAVAGKPWNNANPGVFYRLDGRGNWTDNLVVGTYHNSIRKESVYAAYIYPVTDWLDVSVGLVSGYNGQGYSAKPIMPMVVPSVRFELGNGFAGRIHLAPKVGRGGATAVHFSLEKKI